MDNLSKKKFKIILIHLLWVGFILNASLNTDSFNNTISAVSFFLIEPINLFVVYPVIIYILIYKIIRKEPYTVKDEKQSLLIFSIICTLFSMWWVIRNHIEGYIEDGFSIFLYADYWLN